MTKHQMIQKALLETEKEFTISGGTLTLEQKKHITSNLQLLIKVIDRKSVDDTINYISKDYYNLTDKIVNELNLTPGIASSIQLDSGISTSVYGGNISQISKKEINPNTRFDLASISKIFLALALIEEHKKGNIDIYQNINEINSEYKNLNIPLIDALRFNYNIGTTDRIDERTNGGNYKYNKKQALEILKESIIKDKDFIYSDIPYMIASNLFDYEKAFNELFIKKLGMNETGFNPTLKIQTTGGNIKKLHTVHDPKCQVMEGISGHAGVFSTTTDLLKLKQILKPDSTYYEEMIRPRNLADLSSKENKLGMFYRKHPLGLNISEVPDLSSNKALAVSGFTGTWSLYDPINNFTANFLTNPISTKEGKKVDGYVYKMDDYKNMITSTTFILKVYEKYLEKANIINELSKEEKTYVKKI